MRTREGMVISKLPAVGAPLPLMSDAETSMLSLLAGFGLPMSIHTRHELPAS
jgi:rod shape determining protein RodA